MFVPSVVLAEATSLLKHNDTTTSSIIRIIMNSLIKKEKWSQNGMNFTKIKNEFENEYAACVGMCETILFFYFVFDINFIFKLLLRLFDN